MTVKAFTVVPSRSGVLRPQAEQDVLNLFGARMAAVSLSGYIFFGSSLSISDQVHCLLHSLTLPVRGPPLHALPTYSSHCPSSGPPTPDSDCTAAQSSAYAPHLAEYSCTHPLFRVVLLSGLLF